MLKVAKVAPEMLRSEFENMSDETFEIFFAGIEKAYNDKIEAEKKVEEERIAKEKAEAEERERIRIENERLKAEAEKAAVEKAKLEAELKAKADAEEKARKEAELAAKKAAAAPDKEKIITAINSCSLEFPVLKSEQMNAIALEISEKFASFKNWAIKQTENI